MNIRLEIIKLLEENIGNKLPNRGLGDDFLTQESKSDKSKNKQAGLPQTKNLCTAKETINKMKRQPTEWKIIYVGHISDKELIFTIHKEVIQLNSKTKQKTSNPI